MTRLNDKSEIPQGEWINREVVSCGKILRWRADVVEQQCSKCKRWSLKWRDTLQSEYCSNCGADMRGSNNANTERT